MSYSLEEKVGYFATYSRFGIIILQFLFNLLIPDHNAGVFQKPRNPNVSFSLLDQVVEIGLGGLTRWDGQYFLHIAEYGYTYENTVAFFPLFPLIIRQISNFALYFINEALGLFLPIRDVISLHSTLILFSVLFNNIIFVKTAKILYKLSFTVLKNERIAFISAILFCVNPASIFFSAAYSESLYSFITFYGLLKMEQGSALSNYVILGTTGAVRSNGVVNIGFLIYKYIKLKCTSKPPFIYNVIFNLGIILSILPFFVYQFYCYITFCFPQELNFPQFIIEHGIKNKYIFPGGLNISMCSESVPLAYAYVQKQYWNVGFLKYYKIKQIPNFLLAVPMIIIILRGTWSFVRHYKFYILYLGIVNRNSANELPIFTFPYVLHGFALTVFAVLVVHVQVTTRLVASSSPLPYWFCARSIAMYLKKPVEQEVLKKIKKKTKDVYFYESKTNKKSSWKTFLFTETLKGYSLFIKWYFLLYYVVGTLMFSNYLPWT